MQPLKMNKILCRKTWKDFHKVVLSKKIKMQINVHCFIIVKQDFKSLDTHVYLCICVYYSELRVGTHCWEIFLLLSPCKNSTGVQVAMASLYTGTKPAAKEARQGMWLTLGGQVILSTFQRVSSGQTCLSGEEFSSDTLNLI